MFKTITRWMLYSLLLWSSLLLAAPAHPPLVPDGESFEDIASFKIGSGHSSYVSSVAFSADGKNIVSGSYDNSIKLWDTKNKYLKGDISVIGNNWVWFDNDSKVLKRYDDGNLLMLGDRPYIPNDNTTKDSLNIEITKQIDIYSQKVASIKATITNNANKPLLLDKCY